MKKQSQIEKTAISFALQIFKLIGTFPIEEKSTFGSDLARESVKICSGISTFIHLNEITTAFECLNNAFSATFRVEVYLLASKDLGFVESIVEPIKVLKDIRSQLDEMLNREPGPLEI